MANPADAASVLKTCYSELLSDYNAARNSGSVGTANKLLWAMYPIGDAAKKANPSSQDALSALTKAAGADLMGIAPWPPDSTILNEAYTELGTLYGKYNTAVSWEDQRDAAVTALSGFLKQLPPIDPAYNILKNTLDSLNNSISGGTVIKALQNGYYSLGHFLGKL